MEAAEHFYEAQAAVRAIDDRLLIERLEIDDPRTARVVRERAEAGQAPAQTVVDAIEIGARVLEREGLVGEVDYVRAELERTSAELREQFGDRARAVTEWLGKELNDSRSELVRHFSLDDGRNPLADFKAAIVRSLTEASQANVRQLEANVKQAEAMRSQIAEMQSEIVRLTEQSDARRQIAEVEEKGTAKGRGFEERVFAVLERLASGRGDAALAVGDERSAGGGKQGDVVVEIEAAAGKATGRVVFEIKDERLSKNAAWTVLNEAMAQRDADFAVLVVAGEAKVPAGREPLHEYEGNKLIVAVDSECEDQLPVELAYRYARCRVLMVRDQSLTVDAAGVRDATEAAASALKQAQKVYLALTGIRKGADKAEEGLREMVADVQSQLAQIEVLVADGQDIADESAAGSQGELLQP